MKGEREGKTMTIEDKLKSAMNLLGRVNLEEPPDEDWCRDYFLLTGDHMIRTDEGWSQPFLPPDGEVIEILDEVNECRAAPAVAPEGEAKISLSEAAGKARKTWQEKYGNCSMCDAGDRPEWSPFAKVFIHRHDKLDRRCGNNPATPPASPVSANGKLFELLKQICANAYACNYQQNTFPGETDPCGKCANCMADAVLGENWEKSGPVSGAGMTQARLAREIVNKYEDDLAHVRGYYSRTDLLTIVKRALAAHVLAEKPK